MSDQMQLPPHDDADITSILSSVRGAKPPKEVEARIVERAMAQIVGQEPGWFRVFGLALAGATAAVIAGVGLHLYLPHPASTPAQERVAAGSVHASLDSPTSFRVGPHEVLLSASSKVLVDAAESDLTALRVESGMATFDVEPLDEGETFRVRTGQVLVEVVGTRFSVQAYRGCSVILVEEGRVRVTDNLGTVEFLDEGGRGRYCASKSSDALLREALVLISAGGSLEKAAELLESYLESGDEITLEEDALFHLCLVRARMEEWDEARSLAAEFRERFPTSNRIARLESWLEQ